jgi:hypothetical protein
MDRQLTCAEFAAWFMKLIEAEFPSRRMVVDGEEWIQWVDKKGRNIACGQNMQTSEASETSKKPLKMPLHTFHISTPSAKAKVLDAIDPPF